METNERVRDAVRVPASKAFIRRSITERAVERRFTQKYRKQHAEAFALDDAAALAVRSVPTGSHPPVLRKRPG